MLHSMQLVYDRIIKDNRSMLDWLFGRSKKTEEEPKKKKPKAEEDA